MLVNGHNSEMIQPPARATSPSCLEPEVTDTFSKFIVLAKWRIELKGVTLETEIPPGIYCTSPGEFQRLQVKTVAVRVGGLWNSQ